MVLNVPITIMSWIGMINLWLYAIVCPLKFRPLVCHVSASNASTGAQPPLAVAEVGVFHVKVSTRVFLRASAISMFLVGGMCYVANKWVLGDEAIASLGFREHLHTTPGVVIVAVGTQVCQASRPGSGHRRLEAPSHFRAVLLGLEQSMGRLCPAVHAWKPFCGGSASIASARPQAGLYALFSSACTCSWSASTSRCSTPTQSPSSASKSPARSRSSPRGSCTRTQSLGPPRSTRGSWGLVRKNSLNSNSNSNSNSNLISTFP